jgi:hypothetical protein
MAATIVGDNTITWGAGDGASSGKVQSASRKHGGDKLELLDEDGEAFTIIYFNNKDECEFTAIFLTGVTLPDRGDTITIGGVANCRVDDYDVNWENTNAKKFTIRATKYANIT